MEVVSTMISLPFLWWELTFVALYSSPLSPLWNSNILSSLLEPEKILELSTLESILLVARLLIRL